MSTEADHQRAAGQAITREPQLADDRPAVVGALQRLCRAATRNLPATGVGVTVVSSAGAIMTTAASGPTSVVLEELQFTLGEGPCMSAFATSAPVLIPDLASADVAWPSYASAALDAGVHGVFAFPLRAGETNLGALDVYREQPGALSAWTVSRAASFAVAATYAVLSSEDGIDKVAGLLADGSDVHVEVFQAQGMVMMQLGVSPDEALLRLRAYAFVEGRRLAEVARAVIDRRLVLESDAPRPDDGGPMRPG